jgi:cytochrome oxidase Cu insertion factor (SCO1/SenC/PrrC family)
MNNPRNWIITAAVIIAGTAAYFFVSSLAATQPYKGTELTGAAPGFQLTNQHGSTIKLSDFRGKVVVLTFMDTECTDTCPLTAYHFRQAYQQLEANERERVVFIGVNVNVDAGEVDNVEEITEGWHLDKIPSWQFLTGSSEELEPVWQDYGIGVVHASHDASGGELTHTPGTYIIDLSGQQRWYISVPMSAGENPEFTLPLNELLVRHIRELLNEI